MLVADDPQSAEIIHPWLRGRDISRWARISVDSFVIFTYHGVDIGEYGVIENYLRQFKERLENRATSHRHAWYELQQPQTGIYQCFSRPKIVWPDIADRCKFTLDTQGLYPDATVFMIPNDDEYLLGILNSSVAEWFIKNTSPSIQQGYLRFKRVYLEPLPVPEPTPEQRGDIEVIVCRLLETNSQGQRIQELERKLNALVYEVYGLTEEEIAIVEAETTSDGRNTR